MATDFATGWDCAKKGCARQRRHDRGVGGVRRTVAALRAKLATPDASRRRLVAQKGFQDVFDMTVGVDYVSRSGRQEAGWSLPLERTVRHGHDECAKLSHRQEFPLGG